MRRQKNVRTNCHFRGKIIGNQANVREKERERERKRARARAKERERLRI